jgi:hypothetical protein
MNIYEKLIEARLKIQANGIKKSGRNDYSKYDYFTLKDIIELVVPLCSELKMLPVISFTAESATLEIIDAEKPAEKIVITSPMSRAALKGCHEVQNLGAVQSYLRRYLYMAAFDIDECEGESVDGAEPPSQQKTPPAPPPSGYPSIDAFLQVFRAKTDTMTTKTGEKLTDWLTKQRGSPNEQKYITDVLAKIAHEGA